MMIRIKPENKTDLLAFLNRDFIVGVRLCEEDKLQEKEQTKKIFYWIFYLSTTTETYKSENFESSADAQNWFLRNFDILKK